MKNLFLKISSWMKDEHVIVIFKLWKMNIWYPNSWNSSKVMASNRGTVDNGFEEGPSPSSHKSEKIKKRYFQDCSSYKTGKFILKLEASWKKSPIALNQQQAKGKFLFELFINIFLRKITAILTDRKAKAGSLPSRQWLLVFTQNTNILTLNILNVAEQQNYIICIDSSDSWLVCKSREDLTAPSAPIKYGQSTELPVSDLLRLIQRKCLTTQLTKRYHWSDLT